MAMPQIGVQMSWSHPFDVAGFIDAGVSAGIRHFDTSHGYFGGEQQVSAKIRALQPSNNQQVTRKDLHITVSRPALAKNPEKELRGLLHHLDVGYVDLFLIEGPDGGPRRRRHFWLALEKLKTEGMVKAVGVSNFGVTQLKEDLGYATEPIDAVRLQLNPYHQQPELAPLCAAQSLPIPILATSPLASCCAHDDTVLKEIANNQGESTEDVLVRFPPRMFWYRPLLEREDPATIRLASTSPTEELNEENMARLNALAVERNESEAGSDHSCSDAEEWPGTDESQYVH